MSNHANRKMRIRKKGNSSSTSTITIDHVDSIVSKLVDAKVAPLAMKVFEMRQVAFIARILFQDLKCLSQNISAGDGSTREKLEELTIGLETILQNVSFLDNFSLVDPEDSPPEGVGHTQELYSLQSRVAAEIRSLRDIEIDALGRAQGIGIQEESHRRSFDEAEDIVSNVSTDDEPF